MSRTTKLCYNRKSGQYEWFSENGYSEAQGGYVSKYDWDDTPFEKEREKERKRKESRNERDSWSPNDDMQYYNEFRRTHGI